MNPKDRKAARHEAKGRKVTEVTGIGPEHDMGCWASYHLPWVDRHKKKTQLRTNISTMM